MFDLTQKDIARFWAKVDRRGRNECWPWTAKARHWHGYGLFTIATGKPGGKNVAASRISCFLAKGPSPDGSPHALHSCDNPSCCNPAHLRWGNQRDNVDDAKERKRHVNPPRITNNAEWVAKRNAAMRKGEAVVNSKLSEPVVREIWRLHFEGKNASDISAAVGFSVAAVYDVCRGRSWRHVEGAPSVEELKSGGVRRGSFNQFSNGGDTRALNPRTKIPSSEIPTILDLLASGVPGTVIAARYDVSKGTISKIKAHNL